VYLPEIVPFWISGLLLAAVQVGVYEVSGTWRLSTTTLFDELSVRVALLSSTLESSKECPDVPDSNVIVTAPNALAVKVLLDKPTDTSPKMRAPVVLPPFTPLGEVPESIVSFPN